MPLNGILEACNSVFHSRRQEIMAHDCIMIIWSPPLATGCFESWDDMCLQICMHMVHVLVYYHHHWLMWHIDFFRRQTTGGDLYWDWLEGDLHDAPQKNWNWWCNETLDQQGFVVMTTRTLAITRIAFTWHEIRSDGLEASMSCWSQSSGWMTARSIKVVEEKSQQEQSIIEIKSDLC